MARKRMRNMEALVGAGDESAAEEGEGGRAADRISGSGEEEGKETMRSASVDICSAQTRVSFTVEEEERQEQEEKSIVLAMVHLLVIASQPTFPYPRRRKLTMESLRSIRRFLSSSVLQLQSFVLQGILAAMPALLARNEKSMVVRSMALLGDMALNSYQSMMQITNERVVLQILLSLLSSADTEVQKEACHTIANLASSIQGQRALCEIGAVEKLIWEGFIHMSLYCWAEDQNWEDMLGRGGACQISGNRLSDLYKGLLHVAVRQCGDKCSAFRKACLVAAQPLCKEIHNTDRFQSFFKILLQNVAQTAVFKEALDEVLTAIDIPASTSLDWMHWLRHLPGKHQARDWIDPLVFFHDRLSSGSSSAEGLEDMEVKFTKAKKSFVSCASFTPACDVFIGLLHKYRSVRKRFTNGMLALQT